MGVSWVGKDREIIKSEFLNNEYNLVCIFRLSNFG